MFCLFVVVFLGGGGLWLYISVTNFTVMSGCFVSWVETVLTNANEVKLSRAKFIKLTHKQRFAIHIHTMAII